MSAFLYFVEGGQPPATRDKIAAWGLGYAFDGVPYNAQVNGAHSPTGNKGVILTDQPRLEPFQPVYREGEQDWRPLVRPKGYSGPPAYVGLYRDQRPGPEDLARPILVDGYLLELADGNRWQVPVVRHVTTVGESSPTVPCYLDVDEYGEPIRGDVVEKYRELSKQCVEFFDAWCEAWRTAPAEAGSFAVDWESPVADAMFVLGTNYRIGVTEQAMLRLFREDAAMPAAIMEIACDCLTARLYVKKKAPSDSRSIDDGEAT